MLKNNSREAHRGKVRVEIRSLLKDSRKDFSWRKKGTQEVEFLEVRLFPIFIVLSVMECRLEVPRGGTQVGQKSNLGRKDFINISLGWPLGLGLFWGLH